MRLIPEGARRGTALWVPAAVGATVLLALSLARPGAALPGSASGDIYKHAWAMWHNPATVLLGSWPTTPWLAAPHGGSLFDVMLVPSLLWSPVSYSLGAVAATQLWAWCCLFLVALCVAALARGLGASPVGAAAAGRRRM